jgi:hypothetical protein
VRAAYDELYRRADGRSSGIEVPDDWAERFRSDPDNGVVPGDRGTMYALHELYARAGLARPSDVRPLRRPVPGTASAVRSVGYDRASARLDVELRDGRVATYANVPASVYEEMSSPGVDVDQIFYTRVQARAGGPVAVTYAGSAQDRQRCPDCGQFCDASHVCPSPGAVNGPSGAPRVRMGRAAGAGDAVEDGGGGGVPADQAPQAGQASQGPGGPRAPRLVMAPTRRVTGADFAMVVPSRADIGAFASEHPEFDLPVAAEPDDGGGLVTGTVRVVTDPATGHLSAARADLECTCRTFERDGSCAHTAGTLAGVRAHIAGSRGEHSLRRVSMAGASPGLDERLRAERFPPAPTEVSYGTDMGAFQAAYDAARRRRRGGLPPVEFHPEGGVTGGAAAPGGRGFGVEIEFSCTSAAARQAIARELYEAGLIREPVQHGYHGTQREARSGLWQRWGFESDSSVSGGEIVSPVLFDRPEDWAELATVCRIVRSHGGTVDSTTGCHVHVGAGDFGTTPEAHNALLAEMRDNNKDLLAAVEEHAQSGAARVGLPAPGKRRRAPRRPPRCRTGRSLRQGGAPRRAARWGREASVPWRRAAGAAAPSLPLCQGAQPSRASGRRRAAPPRSRPSCRSRAAPPWPCPARPWPARSLLRRRRWHWKQSRNGEAPPPGRRRRPSVARGPGRLARAEPSGSAARQTCSQPCPTS